MQTILTLTLIVSALTHFACLIYLDGQVKKYRQIRGLANDIDERLTRYVNKAILAGHEIEYQNIRRDYQELMIKLGLMGMDY